MRENIEHQLSVIHNRMLTMSNLVSKSIDNAMEAFVKQDAKLATDILANDIKINRLEQEIEELCVTLAATQCPLGSDLRHMVTILKIVTDLERVGDYSCNIAEVAIEMGKYKLIKPLVDLPILHEKANIMLKNSLKAYFDKDIDLAYATAKLDEEVDELYRAIYHELLSYMKTKSDEENQIIGLILIGRYIERIADHATNICERVIFMETGKSVKF
jgi:phosphate transport system protein